MTDPDIKFHVPFVHRLRFTDDIFGDEQSTLLELLEPSEDRKPRVQFWIDESVAAANPQLKHRVQGFLTANADKLVSAGNVQTVVGGEPVKNDIHILESMLKVINHADLDRRSYIIVIGGGAVLDAVGFAAAIAHRGIRLIRIPTTTLAQGDSGVGVKNSVNLFEKKNWLGSFAVPWGVINDATLLTTLPDRDFIAGFSESVKVALLKDRAFFDSLVDSATALRERDMSVAAPVLKQSAEWHLKHITAGGDPFEMLEARPLDYGHWSAHKMETMSNFRLRHGEAVAIGVAIDTVYSSLKHGLPASDAEAVLKCLAELGFTLFDTCLQDTKVLFDGLEEFRQHLGGRLTVTMLEEVGRPINVHEIDNDVMHEAITSVAEFARSQAIQSAIKSADDKRNAAE
jgi:3-dehydroquinate synthase